VLSNIAVIIISIIIATMTFTSSAYVVVGMIILFVTVHEISFVSHPSAVQLYQFVLMFVLILLAILHRYHNHFHLLHSLSFSPPMSVLIPAVSPSAVL